MGRNAQGNANENTLGTRARWEGTRRGTQCRRGGQGMKTKENARQVRQGTQTKTRGELNGRMHTGTRRKHKTKGKRTQRVMHRRASAITTKSGLRGKGETELSIRNGYGAGSDGF